MRTLLLKCGVAASLVYVGTDIVAGSLYPGYSFTDQFVSELFAIGAPTARLVVPFLNLSSALAGAFSFGVWMSADGNRALRGVAVMLAANATDALVLWNFFPMHMRGAGQTLTDQMHLLLAINPFVALGVVAAAFAFRGRLRFYSLATILIMIGPAAISILHAPQLGADLDTTRWLGLAERDVAIRVPAMAGGASGRFATLERGSIAHWRKNAITEPDRAQLLTV